MERRREPSTESAADEAPATGEALVELVLAEHAERAPRAEATPPRRIHGVVIGVLHGLGPAREALVDFPGNPGDSLQIARSTVPLAEDAIGRAAALMFEEGDPTRPLLLGLIHEPELASIEETTETEETPTGDASAPRELEVEADGERVVVRADKELVLRCGKASITLTAAGKILIRGAYVLTRSSGVNRIQGGSVQIN